LLGAAARVAADPLENAYFLCDVFEKTGVSSECEASNAASTVTVIVDTTPTEAANICTVISRQMMEKRRFFGGRWKLRVFSPSQANEPLAACPLK
jgi:hypothetical protein